MSSESISWPNESSGEHGLDYLFNDIEDDVNKRLEITYSQCTTHDDHLALVDLDEELSKLVDRVLLMAKYQNTEQSIHLDSDMPDSNQYEEAIEILLETLTPDEVPDRHRAIYFLPWSRTLLPSFEIEAASDEEVSMDFTTRIPGVEINYHYPPGENQPQRTIYYRVEN